MMKKFILRFALLTFAVAAIYSIYYYNFVFARVTAVVTVEQKNENSMTVRLQDGSNLQVKAPSIVIPLLKEERFYQVSIYRNKLRAPHLQNILEIDMSQSK